MIVWCWHNIFIHIYFSFIPVFTLIPSPGAPDSKDDQKITVKLNHNIHNGRNRNDNIVPLMRDPFHGSALLCHKHPIRIQFSWWPYCFVFSRESSETSKRCHRHGRVLVFADQLDGHRCHQDFRRRRWRRGRFGVRFGRLLTDFLCWRMVGISWEKMEDRWLIKDNNSLRGARNRSRL